MNSFIGITALKELRRARVENAKAAMMARSRFAAGVKCCEQCLSPELLFGKLLHVLEPLIKVRDFFKEFRTR